MKTTKLFNVHPGVSIICTLTTFKQFERIVKHLSSHFLTLLSHFITHYFGFKILPVSSQTDLYVMLIKSVKQTEIQVLYIYHKNMVFQFHFKIIWFKISKHQIYVTRYYYFLLVYFTNKHDFRRTTVEQIYRKCCNILPLFS